MAGARKNRRSGSCAHCGRKVDQWAGEEHVVGGATELRHLRGVCETAPDGLQLDLSAPVPTVVLEEAPRRTRAGRRSGRTREAPGVGTARPLWRTGGVRALAAVVLIYCGVGVGYLSAQSGRDQSSTAPPTTLASTSHVVTTPSTATSTTWATTTTSVARPAKSAALAGQSPSSSMGARSAGSCGEGSYERSPGDCVRSPAAAPSPPTGATARCADGTYSFSGHRQGTCSHHAGVEEWL